MSDLFKNFGTVDYLFLVFAVGGTTFFILKTIFMFIFGMSDHDAGFSDVDGDVGDLDIDAGIGQVDGDISGLDGDVGHVDVDGDVGSVDVDGDAGEGDLADSTSAFKLFTIHSFTGFVMMFGWAGLTCHLQYELHILVSVFVSFVVGLITMWITAELFQLAKKMVHPGATYNLSETIGQVATVYQTIPENGVGKVTVIMNEASREVRAVSNDGRKVPAFQKVKVIGIENNNTLKVDVTEDRKEE